MALLPDLKLFNRVNRAIQLAATGGKVTAGIADLHDALKNGFRFKFWRNNVLSLDVTFSSGPLIAGNTVVLTAAQVVSVATILDTATNSGTLRAQVETSDGYIIRGTAGRAPADYAFSGDIVAANGIAGLSIAFSLPISLDATANSTYSAQGIIDDMYTANDYGYYMTLYPNSSDAGNPGGHYAYVNCQIRPNTPNWNGSYGGANNTLTTSFGANSLIILQSWGWIGQMDKVWPTTNPKPRGNVSPNTRVRIRNLRQYELLLSGQWIKRATHNMNGAPVGGWYQTSAFDGTNKTPTTGTAHLYDVRDESANGGGQSLGSIGYGTTPSVDGIGNPVYIPASTPTYTGQARDFRDWNYHFFPTNYNRLAQDLINQTLGCWTSFEVDLILHDPLGVDDRDNSDIGALCGQDFYTPGAYLGEQYHSRVRRVTKTPIMLSCTDIPPANVLANPPPFTFP